MTYNRNKSCKIPIFRAMIKKILGTVVAAGILSFALTGCIPSNPAQPYEDAVDDTKQLQKELDKQTDEINNYDPTENIQTPGS